MTAAQVAAAVWSIAHGVGALFLFWIWSQERKRFMLWSALSWLVMALWGVTAGHSQTLQIVNAVVIPPLASALGLIAMLEMTTSTQRHRRANAEQVAMLRRQVAEREARTK